jgi:hypothetical protein
MIKIHHYLLKKKYQDPITKKLILFKMQFCVDFPTPFQE